MKTRILAVSICAAVSLASLNVQQGLAGRKHSIQIRPIRSQIEIFLFQDNGRATARVNYTSLKLQGGVYFLTIDYYAPGKRPLPLARATTKIAGGNTVIIEEEFKPGFICGNDPHLILATMTDLTRPGSPALAFDILPFFLEGC